MGKTAPKVTKSQAPQKKGQQAKAQSGQVTARASQPKRNTTAPNAVVRSVAANKVTKRAGTQRSAGGLPLTPSYRGLTKANDRRGDRGAKIDERLKKKSPWYQSIKEPIINADVKIPDATGVETGTLQCMQRIPLTCDSNGCAAFRTSCLLPNAAPPNVDQGENWGVGVVVTGTVVNWTGTGTVGGWLPTNEPLRAYAQGVRVVSAAVYIQSMASLSQNQGVITSYFRPFPSQLETDGHTIDEYQNMYKSCLTPVNNNKPAVARFLPVKQDGGMYDMFYNPANPTLGGGADTDGPETPYYELGHIIEGCVEGAVFEITICVNYEFIPLFNAINILDARPSPVDAQEVELVENWVQEMPTTEMTTTQVVAKAPQSSTVDEPGSDTGFGMFFEVISELAPLVLSFL